MKRKFIILILVLIVSIILLTSCSFLINPYKSNLKYKTKSLKSIQFEIPDFWKEYVDKYSTRQPNNRLFEDGKNYISIMLLVEETQWNQTFLEKSSTEFLNNSVSSMIFYSTFSIIFDRDEPCKIECKQEIYEKFKIKDFSKSSAIKERFDICVKECREEAEKYQISDYGTKKANNIIKQTTLKDGSYFISEAIGLNCNTDKVTYLLFVIDSNKISHDKIEEIRSHISNSVKCK